MNTDRHSLKATLSTAAAALILTALQLAGIDSLATPTEQPAKVVQLPLVLVTAERPAAVAQVQQLPPVVVVGQRAERVTAQAEAGAEGSAI